MLIWSHLLHSWEADSKTRAFFYMEAAFLQHVHPEEQFTTGYTCLYTQGSPLPVSDITTAWCENKVKDSQGRSSAKHMCSYKCTQTSLFAHWSKCRHLHTHRLTPCHIWLNSLRGKIMSIAETLTVLTLPLAVKYLLFL